MNTTLGRGIPALAVALAVAGLSPRAAHAEAYQGWGPRVGATVNPDQIHAGFHVDMLDSSRRFRLEPSVELGVGDDDPLLSLNLDGAYRFDASWGGWGPYVGGGLGLFIMNGNSDLGAGALFGVDRPLANGNRFFVQGKIGLVDAPDLQITTGWTFLR